VGGANVLGRLWRTDPYGTYFPAYPGGGGGGGRHNGVCSVTQNNNGQLVFEGIVGFKSCLWAGPYGEKISLASPAFNGRYGQLRSASYYPGAMGRIGRFYKPAVYADRV